MATTNVREYSAQDLRFLLDEGIIEDFMLTDAQRASVRADEAAEEAAWNAREHLAYLDSLCESSNA